MGARRTLQDTRRPSPWAAVRVGEASHPGPASPGRRARALRALAQMGLQTGGPDELPVPRARRQQ